MITDGAWVAVASSNVDAARYDPGRQILSIRFHSGGTYHYEGVSQEMALSFWQSESKGRWVYARLKLANWPFSVGFGGG